MFLQLSQVNTSLDEGEGAAAQRAVELLRLKTEQVLSLKTAKSSVDARRRDSVHFVSSVVLEVEEPLGRRLLKRGIKELTELKPMAMPQVEFGDEPLEYRPVVIGFGPAGMFAALLLAQNGYRPLVLERGACMDDRVKAVESFWSGGRLDSETNVQFGEGGAGTFSDGKLTTRINDPLCGYVLREFVRHGAPEDILIKAKPHVGTDLLRDVVTNIRREIIRLGGEVRFLSRAERFNTKNGALASITCSGGEIPLNAAVVAVGHSARDTFSALERCGALLSPKPFSVGARIEHLQSDIDRSLYKAAAGHPNLPAGEYQLSYREGERAAYTFCMCPGGMVAAAASGDEQTVTNGMSYRARDLKNANSALVVSVDTSDYGESWRDAVAFQQRLERAAFEAGGSCCKAPCMRVGDMLKNALPRGFGHVEPSYPIGVSECDLISLFPRQISDFMLHSLPLLGQRLYGFDSSEALLTGVETRTSSPVRVMRNEFCEAAGVKGLYPCGEGAGYAGGITSAAVDGLRCATALMARYKRPDIMPNIEL